MIRDVTPMSSLDRLLAALDQPLEAKTSEHTRLGGAHLLPLVGPLVVMPLEVAEAVDHQAHQLALEIVGRLTLRLLDGDHDVAEEALGPELGDGPGRRPEVQAELVSLGYHREGEHIGGLVTVAILGVEFAHHRVVGEEQRPLDRLLSRRDRAGEPAS